VKGGGGKFYIIGDKAPPSVEGMPLTDHEDIRIADEPQNAAVA